MNVQQIKNIFNSISGKYELSNLVMSFGIERYWRARFNSLIKGSEAYILDACCGTGNSTFAIWKKTKRKAEITGLDFSVEMLDVARKKIKNSALKSKNKNKNKKPADGNISFIETDITSTTLKNDYFNLVTVIFGIRNVVEREKALSELYRLTAPGGKILVMEFNMPVNDILKRFYISYMKKILINLGTFITKNREAYIHLVQSIIGFPNVEQFVKIMKAAGWKNIRTLTMSFNTCVIYEAYK